jgi:hypothetical protein
MCGVGTIPLEARRQGREAIGGDLSELAHAVTRAKLEGFTPSSVDRALLELEDALTGSPTPLRTLEVEEAADFGLNGKIRDYFESSTLREVLIARRFYRARIGPNLLPSDAVVLTALLHILHGNRPYALSRRSHPITPLKPQGPSEHRPVMERLRTRIARVLPSLLELNSGGAAHLSDFSDLSLQAGSVDRVITSPPFAQSLRFFSSNWMRLWFCGWSPDDFRERPDLYLERKQKADFDAAYQAFLQAMKTLMRPGGLLILHLGETDRLDMSARIAGLLAPDFELIYSGRECVRDGELHGLTDKGATRAHGFIFCRHV